MECRHHLFHVKRNTILIDIDVKGLGGGVVGLRFESRNTRTQKQRATHCLVTRSTAFQEGAGFFFIYWVVFFVGLSVFFCLSFASDGCWLVGWLVGGSVRRSVIG